MASDRALYSVVQFCPDLAKAEAANIGVLLYRPEPRFLEARLSESLKRVTRYFAPTKRELHRIWHEVAALGNRIKILKGELESEDDLSKFVAARADRVRLTPPRLIVVDDPSETLESLYTELVGDPERARTIAEAAPGLPPAVAEVFGRMEAARKLRRLGSVVVPVVKTTLDVPYAFHNGQENLIRPEAFGKRSKKDGRLAGLGFAGQLIFKHPEDSTQRQLVVLSVDPRAGEERERQLGQTLNEFSVRFVPSWEAEQFAREAERQAH